MKNYSLFAFAAVISLVLSLVAVPRISYANTPWYPIDIYNISLTDGKGNEVGDRVVYNTDSFSSSDTLQLSMIIHKTRSDVDSTVVTIVQVRDSDGVNQYILVKESNLPTDPPVTRFSIPPIGKAGEYRILIHTWSDIKDPEPLGRLQTLLISMKD